MFRRLIAASLIFAQVSTPAAALSLDDGRFYFRYKPGFETALNDPDSVDKDITAFYIAGLGEEFSENLPMKPEWESDNWQIVKGKLPAGISFNPSTLVFEGKPLSIATNVVVELRGVDTQGNEVATASATFSVYDLPDSVVKVDYYHHTNKYASDALKLPAGVTIDGDPVLISSAPPGVTYNARYFDGTPTKAGVYPVLAFGYDYTHTKPVIAFKGKYTVEDGPTFNTVKDDLRRLTESDYWGCGPGSECAVWYAEGTPKVKRALKASSDIKYSIEVQGNGRLPGSLQFRGGPVELLKYGRSYTAYDQATMRYKAVDIDGTIGHSNWFKIGTLGHAELCQPTDGLATIDVRGTVNSSLSYSIPDSKDQSQKTYTLTAGQLPSGIQFNAQNGSFTGTPKARGETGGVYVQIAYPLASGAAPVTCGPYKFLIAPSALSLGYTGLKQDYRVGEPISVTLAPQGATIAPYSIEMLTGGTLPTGVSFDPTTSKLSGTVSASGDFSATFKLTNGDGLTYMAALAFVGHDPVSVDDVQPKVSIKRYDSSDQLIKFSYDPATVIGTATWSIVGGNLPEGFVFDQNTLTISGGTCLPVKPWGPFKARLTDSTGASDSTNDFYIDVLERDELVAGPTTDPLKFAVNLKDVGQRPFAVTRPALAETCLPNLQYTLSPTTLPDGLVFDAASGRISGTPTRKANLSGYTLKIDELSPYNFSKTSQPFTIEVSDPPAIQDMPLAKLEGTTGVTRFKSADPTPVLRSIRNSLVGFEQSVKFDSLDQVIPGLSLNTATGQIEGVSTVEFNGPVTINYHDGANRAGKLIVPVSVYPFPALTAAANSYDLPRLSDASLYNIAVTPANGGFYAGVTYSLAPNSAALPSGLSLSDGVIIGQTNSAKDKNYAIVIRGTSKADASIFVDYPILLNIVQEVPMNLDVKPDTALIWKINQATGAVTEREKFTSVKPTGSYVVPLAYSLVNAPTWLTIDKNGQLGGTPPTLGERLVTVQVSDAEHHKAADDIKLKVTLDGNVQMSPGATAPLTVRRSETFKTDAQIVTNVVRPFLFKSNGKPGNIDLAQTTGVFKGRIDSDGTFKWNLDIVDADDRTTVSPSIFQVTTIPPVELEAAKSVTNGKQYDPKKPILIQFVAAKNIIGKPTYVVTGNVPGPVVYKYYDNDDPTQLATYILEDGSLIRQKPTDTAQQTEYDNLPPDHMIFDTVALTLKGIPSESGVFNIGLAVSDSHENSGYQVDPSDPTRKPYNFAEASKVAVSVEPASDLEVSNSQANEALYQYTSQPSLTSTVSNDAYGRGVVWTPVSGTLPTNVREVKGSQTLSYAGYPTVQGSWAGIQWEAKDYEGRKVTTFPVSFSVGPRQQLQLVASSTLPRGMVVFDGDANLTISSKNSAYGLALGKSNWTVAGASKLPPGVSYTINDGNVRFTGTSSVIGNYSGITVSGVDSLGSSASIALTFKVISSSDPIELNISDIKTKVRYPIVMEPPFAEAALSTGNTYGAVRFSSDNLPSVPGVSLDPATGYITGTVSTAQNLNFDLVVTDDTNRITRKPVLVSVLPNLRMIMPSQVQAEQGKTLSAPVATDYVLGKVTYEKGAGNWPVGFVVNPTTGEITSSYTNPATGKTSTAVVAAAGTYSGLTIVGKDAFGTFVDQQSSNPFAVVVSPTSAAPDIADQSKTILGTEGVAVVSWAPKAQSGWAAGVVEKGKTSNAWNYAGTVYSSSHDISEYGLIFDQNTGLITGTPTKPFIIRDFVITVTSQRGDTDRTAPFWIGVAPAAPIQVVATQKSSYISRLGAYFATDPIAIVNPFGAYTYSRATYSGGTSSLPMDTNTGVWGGLVATSSSWANNGRNYSTTITDEFNRTGTFTWYADWKPALAADAVASSASLDKAYTSAEPIVKPTVTGLIGNASWVVEGLPAGLSYDPVIGSIYGTASSATVAVGAQTVTFKVKDDYDGVEASKAATITFTSALPDIADQSKSVLGTEGQAISWVPKAASGWAGPVIEKGKSAVAWNYPGTVFEASHDLSKYGLSFDALTGAITGTASQPFIIRDFSIKVTAPSGATDTTAPFWIGVAPAKALAIDPNQRAKYDHRVFTDFRSNDVVVLNYVGDLTFTKASTTRLDFDLTTGAYYKLGDQQLSDYVSSSYNLYTAKVTDEFGRTVNAQISVKFLKALSVTAAASTANLNKVYTASSPVVTPSAANALGNVSWTAQGLPEGLSIDPSTGAVTGAAQYPGATAGVYNVTYVATDDYDGSVAPYKGTITIVAVTPQISDQSKTILGTQGQAVSWALKATTGWAAAVIEQGKSTVAWNYPGTIFEPNYDLSEYGLSFNTSTGAITGTPTKPFVIRDFVVKVTAPFGTTDSTAPFWIGVAPKDAMALPAGFKTSFGVRKGGVLNTTDLQWDNAVGNLTYAKTSGYVGFGVSATTGRVSAVTATSGWPESVYPVGIRVTDEFNRTSNTTITVTVVSPLAVTAPYHPVIYDVQNDNVFTPVATGVLGTPSFVVTGLPQGLSYDGATGRIYGLLDTTKYTYNQSEWAVTITVTDSEDGVSTSKNGTLLRQQGGYRYFRLLDTGSYTYWGCAYLDVYNEFGTQINSLSTTPYGSSRQGLNKVAAQSKLDDGCQVARQTNIGHWVSWDFKSPQNVTKFVVRYDNTWNAQNSLIRAPQFQGSNDNVNWDTLWTGSTTGGATSKTYTKP